MERINKPRKLNIVAASLLFVYSVLGVAIADSSDNGASFTIPEGVYSAEYIGDRDGIAVMEFTGSYDKVLPNGSTNVAARAVVAQEFYKNNPDNYDFLVVFTDFEFETGEAVAFHQGVSNKVKGLGLPLYSNAELYGSAGELKGFIDMAAISRYETNPLTANLVTNKQNFVSTLNVLAHETLHQWAAHTEVEDLQGRDDGHWNFFMDTDASIEYGHDWRDNGDGTFTAESARSRFSQLDLYLMGMVGDEQVPDFFVIEPESDEFLKVDLPKPGITVVGTRKNYTVQDIIDVQGDRIPNSTDSNKVLRYAFIYLTTKNQAVHDLDITRINRIRTAYSARFTILTGGKGVAQVQPSAAIGTEAGQFRQVVGEGAGGTSEVDFQLAIAWLRDQQTSEGNWQDKVATSIRDTALVHRILLEYDPSFALNTEDIDWLARQTLENSDSLARALYTVASNEHWKGELLNRQNDDGGWGLGKEFASSVLDTSLAMCALWRTEDINIQQQISQASAYLHDQQNSDGGWGVVENAKSSVSITAEVLMALNCIGQEFLTANQALDWLKQSVGVDHGFGDGASSVHETAQALLVFFAYEAADQIEARLAAEYIFEQQSINGDWEGSVYTTALAVEALQISEFPNLAIDSIEVDKQNIQDGEFINVIARVINDSSVFIEPLIVRFFQGDPNSGGVEFGSVNLPALPPFASASVSSYWDTYGQAGEQPIFVIADADNLLSERSETDNRKSINLTVGSSPPEVELAVVEKEFIANPDRLDSLPTNINFSALIRNLGNADANTVRLELWQGDPQSNGKLIDSRLIPLAARAGQQVDFSTSRTESGDAVYTLLVDADNQYLEQNEANNRATVEVTSNATVDLVISSADIEINPTEIYLNQNVEFSVNVSNRGTVGTPSFQLVMLIENTDGVTELQSLSLFLEAGEEKTVTSSWFADFDGNSSFIVHLDPDNLIAEIEEGNNTASILINSELAQGSNLSINHQELNFNPSPGLEGMGITLSAIIRNTGNEAVGSSRVAFYDGNPEQNGVQIGEVVIPALLPSQSETAELVWPAIPDDNTRFIYVLADSSLQVAELNESDNTAFSKLQVLSLPDFALSGESITSNPSFPKQGDTVEITISTTNRGKQTVENVLIESYAGVSSDAQKIAETLQTIPGNGVVQWVFDYTFDEFGENAIFVQVDGDNSILEIVESNNSATKSFIIQDSDFFLSNLFFSPDGNGIQDQVEYFFNLPEPQLFSVVVIDKYDTEVRELLLSDQAVQSGSTSWDGKNNQGGVVADGEYTIAVRSSAGDYQGELLVTLDTNRSSLVEAIGTEFGLSRNLTCRMGEVDKIYPTFLNTSPDTQNITYGPNDQYLYFATFFDPYMDVDGKLVRTDEFTHFPTGFYRALSDGTEVTQLLDENSFPLSGLTHFSVSPQGNKLVLVTQEPSEKTLWTINNDGTELLDLHVFSTAVRGISDVQYISETEILYVEQGAESGETPNVLKISDRQNANPELVFDGNGYDLLSSKWEVKLNAARTHALLSRTHRAGDFSQADSSYDFLSRPTNLLLILVDLQNNSFSEIGNAIDTAVWNPQGNSFIVGNASAGKLQLFNLEGQLFQSFSFSKPQGTQFSELQQLELNDYFSSFSSNSNILDGLQGRFTGITWNPDSSEFVFVFEDYLATIIRSDGCSTEEHLYNASGTRTDCVSEPNNIQNLYDRYKTLDGIYLAKLVDSSVALLAKTSTVNASFENGPIGDIDKVAIRYLDRLKRLPGSQNARGLVLNQNGFPVTADGFPYIEWAGASWAVGYHRQSLRSMRWLTGARELLISNGDESQYYDVVEGSGSVYSPDREELNTEDLLANTTILLNLDNPKLETKTIFNSLDLINFESNLTKRGIYPTRTGKFLAYFSDDEPDQCVQNQETKGYRQFQSLLNLTANLRVRRLPGKGGFLLEGSAVDKNFDHYELEYTNVDTPDAWQLLAPPSSVSVIDKYLTTWVPPSRGNFYVRLSVFDLAGNVRQAVSRVINPDKPSITDVYLTPQIFSPNGDGVKDSAELHLRVLENVNLKLQIFDSSNSLVRSISESYDLLGSEQNIQWDGRNELGQTAPDGVYRFVIQDYEFFTEIDNTPPKLTDLTGPLFRPNSSSDSCNHTEGQQIEAEFLAGLQSCAVGLDQSVRVSAIEQQLEFFGLQRQRRGSVIWEDIKSGTADPLTGDLAENEVQIVSVPAVAEWRDFRFRTIARDLAGNEVTQTVSPIKENQAHIIKFDGERNSFGYASHRGFGIATDFHASWAVNGKFPIDFDHSATQQVQFYEVQYRAIGSNGDFTGRVVDFQRANNESQIIFDSELLGLASIENIEIKLRLHLVDGLVLETDSVYTRGFSPKFFLTPSFCKPTRNDYPNCLDSTLVPDLDLKFETNIPENSIDRIQIFLRSDGVKEDSRFSVGTQELGVLLSEDTAPQFGFNPLQNHLIYSYANSLKLLTTCGYNYTLTGQLYYAGKTQPLEDLFYHRGSCLGIKTDVDPVLSDVCNGDPTNLVDITFQLQLAEIGDIDPLFVQIGVPDAETGELASVLHAVNFPRIGTLYTFRLDTSIFQAGELKLRAVVALEDGGEDHEDFIVPIVHQAPSINIGFPLNNDQVCATSYGSINSITKIANIVKGIEVQGQIISSGPDAEIIIKDGGLGAQNLQGGYTAKEPKRLGLYDSENNLVGPEGPSHSLKRFGSRKRASDGVTVNPKQLSYNPVLQQLQAAGVLGIPLVSSSGQFSMDIEANNWSGARQCMNITAQVDAELDGLSFSLEGIVRVPSPGGRSLAYFSPNEDGKFDRAKIKYLIDEPARVTIEIFSTNREVESATFTDDEQIAVPFEAAQVFAGDTEFAWDGTTEQGDVAPDGVYRVYVFSEDGCGNIEWQDFLLGIDTTPPEIAISYPQGADNIAIQIRVIGVVDDLNPAGYQLSVSSDGNNFSHLHSGQGLVDGVLGEWDSFGQLGLHVFRLTAVDLLGNESQVESLFDLPIRTNLISSLTTTNYYVSPNADQRLDHLTIRTSFAIDVNGIILIRDQQQNIVRQLADQHYLAGYATLFWDGKNDQGNDIQDGVYTVEVTAQGGGAEQTESVAFELDTQIPSVVLANLNENYIELKGGFEIFGAIEDKNFQDYQVSLASLSHPGAGDLIIEPTIIKTENRSVNGLLASIPNEFQSQEQEFELTILAGDLAGNQSLSELRIVIDRKPPRVEITAPTEGLVTRQLNSPINISAVVEDKFLKDYSLFSAATQTPDNKNTVFHGTEPAQGPVTALNISSFDDGDYIISISAQDKGGLSAQDSIRISVDNQPPTIAITQPANNGYLTKRVPIIGSANDAHFEQYTIALANGHPGAGGIYQSLISSNQAVTQAVLHNWSELPPDGKYTLKLTAQDTAANQATGYHPFTIDTQAPQPPILSSVELLNPENRISLNWLANAEPDLAGYNLYRNGNKTNNDLLTDNSLIDEGLPEGRYRYVLTAVDQAGWESEDSNALTIDIDTTPPITRILSPSNAARVSQLVNITGSAFSENDFSEYRIYIVPQSGEPLLIEQSNLPLSNSILTQWNTFNIADDSAIKIRLEAEDTHENQAVDEITVIVDNKAGEAPQNLAASVEGSQDARITWEYDTSDPDLLGFILFRNGQLVNSDGPVVGDLRPFAIVETFYLDKSLDDGEHTYVVHSVDRVGNVSDPSNSDSVSLDNRAPKARIVDIEDGLAFNSALYLKAESADTDIASIVLQYRVQGSFTWIDISIEETEPYDQVWQNDSLDFGIYELRAVATDLGGRVDPDPEIISVNKQDLIAPAQVKNLEIQVVGDVGSLSWDQILETDIEEYVIYQAGCTTCEFQELVIVDAPDTVYQDIVNVEASTYYAVAAVDEFGNTGIKSDPSLGIYTQTVGNADVFISNAGAAILRLEITNQSHTFDQLVLLTRLPDGTDQSSTIALGSSVSEAEIPVTLDSAGVYRLSVAAQSTADNFIANAVELNLISQGTPSTPVGLSVVDDIANSQVTLQWDLNSASEGVFAYKVFRNGVDVEGDNTLVEEVSAFSNVGGPVNNFLPNSGRRDTWVASGDDVRFGQSWLEPKLVKHLELEWSTVQRSATGFDVFALIDGELLQIATYDGSAFVQEIEIPTGVVTTQIEIRVRKWFSSSIGGRLAEMRVYQEVLFSAPDYFTEQPNNGLIEYQVQAVGPYGGLSELSEVTTILIEGNEPLSLELMAGVDEAYIYLEWNELVDAQNYNIYLDGALFDNTEYPDYEFDGMPNGTYQVFVAAVNSNGNEFISSNEETVLINLPLLNAPSNLTAEANQELIAISLNWETIDQQEPHFNIYRSEVSGGEFQIVGQSYSTSFVDGSIRSGTRYFYRVTAQDDHQNESAFSNRADALVPDSETEHGITISLPTDSSTPINFITQLVDVAGVAEPGSDVYLAQGDDINTIPVVATATSQRSLLAIESENQEAFSIGGKFRVFNVVNSDQPIGIWQDFSTNKRTLVMLRNGELEKINLETGRPFNPPTQPLRVGKDKILFKLSNISSLVFMYSSLDDSTEQIEFPLVSDIGSLREIYSYSEQNQILVVEISVPGSGRKDFILNLANSQVIEIPQNYEFRVSPNGRYLAYTSAIITTETDVTVVDMLTGESVSIALANTSSSDQVFQNLQPWSADSSAIILAVNSAQGNRFIRVFDHLHNTVVDIVEPATDIVSAAWSGTKRIFYVSNIAGAQVAQLMEYNIDSNENKLVENWFDQNLLNLRLIGVSADRTFYLTDQDARFYYRYTLAGRFRFNDVLLQAGENVFSAIAVNQTDEISDPAEPIIVNFLTNPLPDLMLDLDTNPELPIVNRDINIQLRISNQGELESQSASLKMKVFNSNGTVTELLSQQIGQLAVGSSISVEVPWAPDLAGGHTLFAEVDSENLVSELSEANNARIEEIEVLANDQPILTTTQNLSAQGNAEFELSEPVSGEATILNPGDVFNGKLIIEVIDENASVVEKLAETPINDLVNAASVVVPFSWSVGDTTVGSYQIKFTLLDQLDQIVVSETSDFRFAEALKMLLGLRTNLFSYTSNQEVRLDATTINNSSRTVFASGILRLTIRDIAGQEIYQYDTQIAEILADNRVITPFTWNTALSAPGGYSATVKLIMEGEELLQSSTNFEIIASLQGLNGSLQLDDPELIVGQELLFASTVHNVGNIDYSNLLIKYELLLGTQMMRSNSETVVQFLPTDELVSNQSLDTVNLADDNYKLRLSAIVFSSSGVQTEHILDEKSVLIIENTPPLVAIEKPLANELINSIKNPARVNARDDSGVALAQAKLDQGEWFSLQPSLINTGIYTAALSSLIDGSHIISTRATDSHGNSSNSVSNFFVVDNTSPAVSFLNIEKNQQFEQSVTPQIEVSDVHLQAWTARLNGESWQPQTEITQTGFYNLVVQANDNAGNSTRESIDFIVGNPQPDILKANDDQLSLNRGVWGTIDVLANDEYKDLQEIEVSILTPPTNGSLVKAAKGKYNYFPRLSFVGSDSFTYQLVAGASETSEIATVLVDVRPSASCSYVPDHSISEVREVALQGWAKTAGDNATTPKYKINIIGTSNDTAFVTGNTPTVSFPDCSLSYTPKDNIRKTVVIQYRVTDVASNGAAYTSPIREFKLTIKTGDNPAAVLVPIIKLLILDKANED